MSHFFFFHLARSMRWKFGYHFRWLCLYFSRRIHDPPTSLDLNLEPVKIFVFFFCFYRRCNEIMTDRQRIRLVSGKSSPTHKIREKTRLFWSVLDTIHHFLDAIAKKNSYEKLWQKGWILLIFRNNLVLNDRHKIWIGFFLSVANCLEMCVE